jgi:nucleotide-binding universal stress UspA family protein
MKLEFFVPRSILVPIDDRLGVAPSLRLVERLAAAARARVTLLQVIGAVNPAAAHDSTSLNLAAVQAKAALQDAGASLWALADQLRGHGLEAASLVDTGDIANVILGQAAALKVDLLVLGTRSPPLPERLLLGSVADRVIQRAQMPILVVPSGATLWRASQPVDVLVTLDGSPLAERALAVGIGLAQLLDGGVHLLRVVNQRDDPNAKEYVKDVASALRSGGLPNVRASAMTSPSTGETIRMYAHEHGVGLIALASHGRGGLSRALLGSVAAQVLTTAAIPVVLIPPLAHVPAWRRADANGS